MYHTALASKEAKPLDLFQKEIDPQQYDFPPSKRKTPMNFKIPNKPNSNNSSIQNRQGLAIQAFQIKSKSQQQHATSSQPKEDEDVVQVQFEDYLKKEKTPEKKEEFVTFSQIIKPSSKLNLLLEPVKKQELKPSLQTFSEIVIPSPKSTRKIEEPPLTPIIEESSQSQLPTVSTQQPIVIPVFKSNTRPASATVHSSKSSSSHLYTIDQSKPWFHRSFHVEETMDKPNHSFYQTLIPQASDWMYQKLNNDSQTRTEYYEKLLSLIHLQKEDTEEEINRKYVSTAPIPVNVKFHQSKSQSSPYVHELALQRRSYSDFIDALRYEEQVLLEQKKEEEMEKQRGPFSKWFEIRDKRFAKEVQKFNDKTMTNGYYKTKQIPHYQAKKLPAKT